MLFLYSEVFSMVSVSCRFWIHRHCRCQCIMSFLFSQVHFYPGPQIPRGEETGGHHENRIRNDDVCHTQNTNTLKRQRTEPDKRKFVTQWHLEHPQSEHIMRTVGTGGVRHTYNIHNLKTSWEQLEKGVFATPTTSTIWRHHENSWKRGCSPHLRHPQSEHTMRTKSEVWGCWPRTKHW